MPIYDATATAGNPIHAKGWTRFQDPLLEAEKLRIISRGGVKRWAKGNLLLNGDHVMAFNTDLSGDARKIWRTHSATVYTVYATWNVGNETFSTNAQYGNSSQTFAAYRNTWRVNATPLSGTSVTASTVLTNARIRMMDVSGFADQVTADGTLVVEQGPGSVGIRIGSKADMISVFGNNNIFLVPSSGTLILEYSAPPPPVATYTELARWNITTGSGSAGNIGAADYFAGVGAGTDGPYRAGFFCNTTPLSGGTNLTAITIGNDTYRLRTTGGTLGNRELVGTLTIEQPDSAFRRAVRIGTGAEMRTAFGSTSTSSGGQVILERQDTPTPTYTEQARWNAGNVLSGPIHDGNLFYDGTVAGTLNVGTVYTNPPAASGSFPASTTGTWRLRQVGGGTITGSLTRLPDHTGGVMNFRIGSVAEMQTAFGTSNIDSGGQWILERQN